MRSLLCLVLFATTANAGGTRRVIVDTPLSAYTGPTPHAGFSAHTLFVNRCSGGCVVHGGSGNDARTQSSNIPTAGTSTVAEFSTGDGQTGAAADADWAAVMKCLTEVYSPYALTVTDVPPAATESYTEAIVAGFPADIGLADDILGIAPLANDCSPQANVISFTFANHHGLQDRVNNICWTAAQESAHAFGLDHEFQFVDGSSACPDPMTYRSDCGGEHFFRDHTADCGEYTKRACKCGATQNSHHLLTTIFGAATPITTAHAEILVPPPTATTVVAGFVVQAAAGAQRGVERVELRLNGSPWVTKPGAPFGATGQLDPSTYPLITPKTVPDGVIDLEVRAYDDLGIVGTSTTLSVLKGEPCTSAATCLTAQKCDPTGRCYWDPPTGELGDSCGYAQQCKSNQCAGGQCVQVCDPTQSMSCPAGYTCAAFGNDNLCTSSGGCCNVGGDPRAPIVIALFVFGLVLRRRR